MSDYLLVIGSLIAGILAILFGASRKRKLDDAKRAQLENLKRERVEQARVLDGFREEREQATKVAHAKVEDRLLDTLVIAKPTTKDANNALKKLQDLKKRK